jgi:hypothetical protein
LPPHGVPILVEHSYFLSAKEIARALVMSSHFRDEWAKVPATVLKMLSIISNSEEEEIAAPLKWATLVLGVTLFEQKGLPIDWAKHWSELEAFAPRGLGYQRANEIDGWTVDPALGGVALVSVQAFASDSRCTAVAAFLQIATWIFRDDMREIVELDEEDVRGHAFTVFEEQEFVSEVLKGGANPIAGDEPLAVFRQSSYDEPSEVPLPIVVREDFDDVCGGVVSGDLAVLLRIVTRWLAEVMTNTVQRELTAAELAAIVGSCAASLALARVDEEEPQES